MLEQLLLRIIDLLKTDEISFKKKLSELEIWAKKVTCPYSKVFAKDIVSSLSDEKDLIKAKRVIRKFQKKIKVVIAINK